MTTRVVNLRNEKPIGYVYIGRLNRYHPKKYPQTKWGNPFNANTYGLEKCIEMYREYIMNKPELLKLIPIELKDKTLGCWCAPLSCHGDVLAKLADSN